MYNGESVTAIVPCLNEERGVEQVLRAMPECIDEVIVVDNGSTDSTRQVARSFGAKVIVEDKRGYGRAYKSGFANASGDIIVTLDGDHSYPAAAISYLLGAMQSLGVDFLSASRFPIRRPEAMGRMQRVGNLILSLGVSLLFLRWVRDSQSGMWIFRRSILDKIRLDADNFVFTAEIKIEAIKRRGIGFAEVPILYSARLGGVTKLSPWRDGLRNLFFMLRKRLQS